MQGTAAPDARAATLKSTSDRQRLGDGAGEKASDRFRRELDRFRRMRLRGIATLERAVIPRS